MPEEPVILLSYINTLLRDGYENLEELCAAKGVSSADIISKLSSIDYKYDERKNQFI